MLVLSRLRDEEIVLVLEDGSELLITQVDIRGDKSRIGVDAPKSIQVHRREVWERIKFEGKKRP